MSPSRSVLALLCGVFLIATCVVGEVAQSEQIKSKPSKSKISLITINEDDWDQILKGEWMVEFHAPWCPACRNLQPIWKDFSTWSEDLGIKVGAVDVTANPGLSGRFLVTALPTIFHVKDGVFRQYKGSRDANSFVSFVEGKKWQSVEQVSAWKAPDSIQMSIVSCFFKISMALRSVHNSLVEDYGIPYWGSYIIFAFSTILFGAILGLMIVCLIDQIFPARSHDELLKQGGDGQAASGDLDDDTADDDKDDEEEDLTEDEEEDEDDDEEEDEEGESEGPQEEVIKTASSDSEPEAAPKMRQRKARRDV